MGKTNFTFVRTLLVVAALGLFGLNQASAQCFPVGGMTVVNFTETSVTLQWTSAQASVIEHCWNVEIGGAGFAVGSGTAIVAEVVCWNDPNLTIAGNTLTYTFDGLIPGTCHDWYVAETCDGLMPPFNNSGWSLPGPTFCTFDSPFMVEWEAFKPTCPEVSPGYIPDGSFTVTVTDPTTCPGGTYDIVPTAVAGSSPLGNTPPNVIPPSYPGVPAGTYPFFFAGAGDYDVVVTEVGICNPMVNPEVRTVTVPDGMDMEDPIWYLTDVLGNVVADNDPFSAVTDNENLNPVYLPEAAVPEGSCSFQMQLYAFGLDNCDGLITATDAASATAIGLPILTFPGTQVNVIPDGLGQYLVDINWQTGISAVIFTGMDAAGNSVDLTVSLFVNDNVNPSITIVGANNNTIAACEDSREITVSVYIDDGCDQTILNGLLLGNLDVDFNGTETLEFLNPFGFGAYLEYSVEITTADDGDVWEVTYEDVYGNIATADVAITVVQAAEDQDPIIVAANENVLVPVCDDDDFIWYSFQIFDDCADINEADINFDDGGSGLAVTFVDVQGRSAFVEVTGDVAPGTYFPVIEYQGSSVSPAISVEAQQDQPAVIVLPGNLNYTIPVCESELTTTWSITISDDCDDLVDPANASFTLGGAAIAPVFVNDNNAGSTYFEFQSTLTAAANGAFIVAEYVDGSGNFTAVDAEVTITEQPDNWAPIIVYPSQDINVELDPCDEAPALIVFEVTATDNCDGNVTPDVSFAPGVDGVMILPTSGGSTYEVAALPGSYDVLITATDAAGNTRTEDFTITVSQDARPQTNLGCNDNINVTLNDDCQAVIVPDMVLEGNFGCLTDDDLNVVVVDSDISNGNVVDGCGDFIYEVTLNTEAIVGFTGPFAPQNWTIVELGSLFGSDDEVIITQDQLSIISGGNGASASITLPSTGVLSFDYEYFIEDDIIVDVFLVDINNNNILSINSDEGSGSIEVDVEAGWVLVFEVDGDGFQTFGQDTEVYITNFQLEAAIEAGDFTTCWGYVHSDDKTAPVVDCPDNTDQATVPVQVQFVTGELTTDDESLVLVDYTCFLDAANPQGGLHYYDLHTFQVTADDVYTFDMVSDFVNFDGAMAMFQGDFDPNQPCSNIIAQSDVGFTGGGGSLPFLGFGLANFPTQPIPNVPAGSSGFDPIYRISLPLKAGSTYTLMATTFGTEDTGGYTFAVYSDGNGLITGYPSSTETLIADLICTDIDEILIDNEMYFTDRDGNTLPGTMSPSLRQRLDYTGRPTVSDNCGDVKVTVNDVVTEAGDCGDVTVTRTFYVEDKQNNDCVGTPNTDVCTQTITVRKPTTSDVIVPPFTVFLECDEGFDTDDNGNPHPSVSGFPWVHTAFGLYDLNQSYCNLGASYSDEPRVVTCENSYKVRREWNIFDWCEPSNLIVVNQILKVGDFTAPTIECPFVDYDWDGIGDLITYSTGPFDCTASFQVPLPTVTDNCSTWEITTYIVTDIVVDITNQYGQVIDQGTETIVVAEIGPNDSRFVSGIPVGDHRFKYHVVDACDNEAELECDFRVVDEVEPVAICDDDLNISIGGQGYARVYAEDVDEGSYDNCGPVTIDVRREGGVWGPHVDFDCADVHTEVRIELRATDANGLTNICWLDVLIEDKIRPFCVAPHNVDIDCDEVPYDFDPFDTAQLQELFGEASADDNCDGAEWEELTPIVQLHDCGFGRIIRRFRASDVWGNLSTNSCQQIVTINEVHDYEIKFPRDAEANCGTPSPDTIEYNEIACDLLAVSVEDEFFSASGDECYKIFRTFRVINWCEYDGEADPRVVSRDEDCDGNPGDENVWVLVRPNGVTYYDRDNDEGNNNPFAFTKSDDCDGLRNPTGHWINSNIDGNATMDPISGNPDVTGGGEGDPDDYIRDISSVGYWQYTQVIKVYDNIEPEITFDPTDPFCSIDNVNCDTEVSVPFSVDENCTPDDLTIKIFLDAFADGVLDADLTDAGVLSGEYPDYTIGGEYPLGGHAFEVHVEDGCGNVNSVIIPFSVVDCKAPTPICINGLSIELMPVEDGVDADGDGDEDTGAMAIWAIDFIASPVSDCSEPIKYSINRVGDTPVQDQTGIVLTCDDDPTTFIEIYAWDSAFNPYAVQPDGTVGGPNYDHCETFILVQDNLFDLCDPTGGIIAGVIETEEDEAINGVEVTLSGDMDESALTAVNGGYEFTATAGGDYSVTPLLDLDHSNGVSTFDLVLISRHILGVQPLDSPYKMIAADADNSGFISVSDLIQIRKLILSVISEFENNTSWRFVDAAYEFPLPTNPWFEEFPEIINVNNLQAESVINGNFIGAKIGDVNGDVVLPDNFASLEDRTVGTFAFNVAEQAVKAGQEFTVAFTGEQMAQIAGYQLTLNFDNTALKLVDVVYGATTADNFGFRFVDEGAITTSWDGEATADEVLFTLVFRGNTDANLSDLLSISSHYTKAEAYTTDDELMNVAIKFAGTTSVEEGFELFQNTPNPFKGETVIGFELPQAMEAMIKLQDVTGRTLQVIRGDFAKGYNEVKVSKDQLPQAGILYYTLETADYTATKKMIIIE